MSAARSAATHARRAPAAPYAHRQSAAPAPRFTEASEGEDSIRVHLSDLPRGEISMDVEGFKPSILSRIFDLISPIKSR